jgi:RimJ/RimL family protein N-acetyltransferase
LRIKTSRLEIIPYSRSQLERVIDDPAGVAREIGAIYGTVPYDIRETQRNLYAMKLRIIDMKPEAWLFATAWQIVSRYSRLIVGEIGFKGIHPKGEVELGYTTRYEHRCRGIMTEAVSEICHFAFEQDQFSIKIVSALTLPGNLASEAVLKNNGFIKQGTQFGKNYWVMTYNSYFIDRIRMNGEINKYGSEPKCRY